VLSLVYRLLRCLLGLLAMLVRFELSEDAELLVLRHENLWGFRIRPPVMTWGF
jgi:putative transposase